MATIPTVTADGVRGHEFLLWTCLNTSPDGAKITMMDNTIINCFICFSLEEAHVILGLVPNSRHKIKLFLLCSMAADQVLPFVDYVMVLHQQCL